MPPSSSGLGRSPLKAETGVRFPLGASESDRTSPNNSVEEFLSLIRFDQRNKLEKLDLGSRLNEEIESESP
jgi:hypothetical protein